MIDQLTLYGDPSSVNHHLLLITLSGGVMDAKLAADWEGWTGHWSNYTTHLHAVIGASHNSEFNVQREPGESKPEPSGYEGTMRELILELPVASLLQTSEWNHSWCFQDGKKKVYSALLGFFGRIEQHNQTKDDWCLL